MKPLWKYHTIPLCLLACCLTSCIYEHYDPEKCGDIPIKIVNDWSQAPGANPEGMAYIFFNEQHSEPWRFDFPGAEAGEVRLPQADYSFISFNDDTYHTIIRGDSYASMKATTWTANLPHDIDNAQPAVESPDMLWGCTYCRVSVAPDRISYIPSYKSASATVPVVSLINLLTARQRQITPRYRLIIEDVENLEGVSSMSAALSGMAGSYLFADDLPGDYPSTLTLQPYPSAASTISAQFSTFGIPANPDSPNILYLFITLTDRRAFIYRFDVTRQVREAPDPMSVAIILRGLALEKSNPDSEGGFGVNVDGWTTIDINIID